MKTKIALGADHAGYQVKKELMSHLTEEGYKVIDLGTHSEDPCDYPEIAERVAKAVASGRCDRGILACGSGIGMDIAANKVQSVRAAVVWNTKTAKLASQHNWANVLSVPSRFASTPNIKKMVQAWLATPYEKGGRHERRVKKIEKIEAKAC
jgi:ribose 5-phosphate isomerase B